MNELRVFWRTRSATYGILYGGELVRAYEGSRGVFKYGTMSYWKKSLGCNEPRVPKTNLESDHAPDAPDALAAPQATSVRPQSFRPWHTVDLRAMYRSLSQTKTAHPTTEQGRKDTKPKEAAPLDQTQLELMRPALDHKLVLLVRNLLPYLQLCPSSLCFATGFLVDALTMPPTRPRTPTNPNVAASGKTRPAMPNPS